MKLPIRDSYLSSCDGLDCPSCGGNYLHHVGLAYFSRAEDAKRGDSVLLSNALDGDERQFYCSHISNAAMNDCPSPRRHGMSIFFECEDCESKLSLFIFQHKGQTFIEWDENSIINFPLQEIKVKRQTIKPSLRFEILKRDDYCCQMCGATAKDGVTLEIDHVTPVSKGGSNDADNLQVLCRDCNIGKSDNFQ